MHKDYKLCVLLQQTGHVILKARERELNQHGISPAQAEVMFVIAAIGSKATPTEISQWLLREPHSISSILTRMEKEGLVSKVKNREGNGYINVSLTTKGQQIYNKSLNSEAIEEIISCLSEEEHGQLESSLKKIRKKALNLTVSKKLPFP